MNDLSWYIARSSGIVGWALLTASVLWGLALSTRFLGRRPRPAWLLDMHRYLGGAATVFTGIHIGALLLDTYADFSLTNVLVPFTGTWRPVAVAWGVVALYLLAAVEVTSLLSKHLSKRAWRMTHYLSFPLFGFSTIHLLTAGTSATNPILFGAVVAAVGAVVWLSTIRVQDSLRATVDRAPAGATR